MSIKVRFIKMAIKMAPMGVIIWVANKVLKQIAELKDFKFDLDTRTVYVQTLLYGEELPIEISLENFSIHCDGDNYYFILPYANSNRPWLNTIFSHLTGRTWRIPAVPQLAPYMGLVAELLAPVTPRLVDDNAEQ